MLLNRKVTMKGNSFSIKNMLISVFMLFLALAIITQGTLIFQNWIASSRRTAENIATDINDHIYEQINFYMYMPYYINETSYRIIQNGILDMTDEDARNKFFTGVMMSNTTGTYSFAFGTADGEYYGARRNQNGEIEIMKNNKDTGGNSWYYSVNDDMTMGELIVQAGKFDPRTRVWYKAAADAEGATFSPIYKHFIMDDITISATWPVYDSNKELIGVLGTHMLLSDIDTYLSDAVERYGGYAIIFENDSLDLVSNSMGINNYTTLPDGSLTRTNISDISMNDVIEAHEQYILSKDNYFHYKSKDGNFFISTQTINMQGINWIVMSAIPESFLMKDITRSMTLTGIGAAAVIIMIFAIYIIMTNKLLKPMNSLLDSAHKLADGELSSRVRVTRNDEIGLISESFNKVADKMQSLVEDLEANVQQRTDELRLILDSAAEGIYGIDIEGNCTFCNTSCLRILGYEKQEDLIGNNMHTQIHHSYLDNSPFDANDCMILKAIQNGKGYESDQEVFWRSDNTYFNVEYSSYPQIKNGKVVGGVITFTDITERKKREDEIEYLSCYDSLTRLHNRSCFEKNKNRVDKKENYPLSVIFADLNGLKMTNDIFGHDAGDALIKKSAEILLDSCRKDDLVSRVGGDEFIILLPKTDEKETEKVIEKIREGFSNARLEAIKCSIALGADTKNNESHSFDEILANAENAMYKDKTMNRHAINKDIIDNIVETLHSRSEREKQHSVNVQKICTMIGNALNLPRSDMDKLERAAYLHDIGKIILDKSLLLKHDLSEEEKMKMKQHPAIGYRILNLFDDTLDLAEYVYNHHERWDGLGFPRGIAEEDIPLISRIIAIVETYDRIENGYNSTDIPHNKDINKQKAVEIIEEGAGKQFDPVVVKHFVKLFS